jgi:hypothetical protein
MIQWLIPRRTCRGEDRLYGSRPSIQILGICAAKLEEVDERILEDDSMSSPDFWADQVSNSGLKDCQKDSTDK